MKLGIKVDISTFQVKNSSNEVIPNLYTIGSNLKGELWESTAVGDLRDQAQKLSLILVED